MIPIGGNSAVDGRTLEDGMGKTEGKFKATLPRDEMSKLLRDLADGLESDTAIGGDGMEIELADFSKLKLSVKRIGEEYAVKFKVESSEEKDDEEAEDEGETEASEGGKRHKIKYDDLKERMDKDFKAMRKASERDELPPGDIVFRFLDDSALMVTFTDEDMGPEYYEEYVKAVDAYRRAYEQGDALTVKQAVLELDRIKSVCHERYK
jgi:XXXCH domain-containing protein